MAIICTVEHVFLSSTLGTPPFTFGFKLQTPDLPDPGACQTFTDGAADAYTAHLAPLLVTKLGEGNVIMTVPDPFGELTFTSPVDGGSGAGDTTPPGCSFRLVFTAPRPPKARNNGCYLPLASPGLYDANGSVHSSVGPAAAAWGAAILSLADTLGGTWVATHQVGGPSAPVATATVTGVTAAATISFLRKRYR